MIKRRGPTNAKAKCLACGSYDVAFWTSARDVEYHSTPDAFVYVRCADCGALSIIDVPTKRAAEVAHGNLTVSGAPSWSPDGTRLAFQAQPTTMLRETRSDIYVVTIADKSMKKITPKSDAA